MRHGAWMLLPVSLLFGLGCMFGPPKPFQTTLVLRSLRVHDQAEVTKDDVTVSIAAILPDNERSFPDVYKMVTWDGTRSNGLGEPVPYQAQGASTIVPEPSFQVRIANHTGHVVRFTQTVFRLQDNRGKTYQTYRDASAIESWLENTWTSAFGPQIAAQVMPQFHSSFGRLLLLDRNVVLLDGDEWSGYLVFNLGLDKPDDFARFMDAIDRLTLRIAEVPVELADDGTVSKTAEFSFDLDRTTLSMAVTCPGNVETPDLANCTKDQP